jgi:hypothetical protein
MPKNGVRCTGHLGPKSRLQFSAFSKVEMLKKSAWRIVFGAIGVKTVEKSWEVVAIDYSSNSKTNIWT